MSRARLFVDALRVARAVPCFTGELRERLERDPGVLCAVIGVSMVRARAERFGSSFVAALEGAPINRRRVHLLTWALAEELGAQLGALARRAINGRA